MSEPNFVTSATSKTLAQELVFSERVTARPTKAGSPPGSARSSVHPHEPGGEASPVVRREPRDGRVPSTNSAPADGLTDTEARELNLLAFGVIRKLKRRAGQAARSRELLRMAASVGRLREPSLIASLGADGAAVQPWEGVIGAEGQLTGDGRLIEHAALTWAALPLPLRYAPADHGGHDGAVLVGRIDAIERRDDGTIYARGVLDLGSELGREAVRLIRSGMLTGVSLDLDSTTSAPAAANDPTALLVTSRGRVRAATLVAIPAFDDARITLTDARPVEVYPGHADECSCTDPWAELPGLDQLPGLDEFPGIDEMPTPFRSLTAPTR